MVLRFSDDFLKVLEFSRDEAMRTGWHNIAVDHIILGILRQSGNGACRALEALGQDLTAFKCSLDESLSTDGPVAWDERESVHLCDGALSMLQHAALEMARCGATYLETQHFLFAVSRIAGSYSHDYLDDCGISLRALVEASGLEWASYGLDRKPVMPNESETNALPDPALLAEAIEQRLREGYTTENPLVS